MNEQQRKAVEIITGQQQSYIAGDLEYLVAELLKDIVTKNPESAEIIGQDIRIETMNLKAAGKCLYDYAAKHKKGGSYGMDDTLARKLLGEFYRIPLPASDKALARQHISLADLL